MSNQLNPACLNWKITTTWLNLLWETEAEFFPNGDGIHGRYNVSMGTLCGAAEHNRDSIIPLIFQGIMMGWGFEEIMTRAETIFKDQHQKVYGRAIGQNIRDFMNFLYTNLTEGSTDRRAVFSLIRKRFVHHFEINLPDKENAASVANKLADGIIEYVTHQANVCLALSLIKVTDEKSGLIEEIEEIRSALS